jgi:hypothetical protein
MRKSACRNVRGRDGRHHGPFGLELLFRDGRKGRERFEYEELEWHRYRSFSADGDSTADVRWPEHALEPGQRISERRETYHAKFSANADGDEHLTELDEATWRTLKVGLKCRLKMGSFSDEVKQVTPLRG